MSNSIRQENFSRDRAFVKLSRKYQPAKYESLDIDVGLSSDMKEGESEFDCLKRVGKLVEERFERLCKSVKKGGN